MALTVSNGGGAPSLSVIQGSSPGLQGSSPYLQGSSPSLQGSANTIQNTAPASVLYTAKSISVPGGSSGGGGASAAQVAAQQAAAQQAAAAAAQAAKINNMISDQTGMIEGNGANSINTANSNYNNQAMNLLDTLRQGQQGITQARTSIAQNQINSVKSLINTIRQGLQSGAVRLGNSNALDSSAAGAVARAYSNYGNEQRNDINNQAATQNAAQDIAQSNLNVQQSEGMRNLQTYRDSAIQQIGNDTQNALLNLDAYANQLGASGKVDVQGIKNSIISQAQAKLAGVDQYLQQQLGGIQAPDQNTIAQNAYALSNAGVTPSTGGLTYQLADPSQSSINQLGGAQLTQLPLYLKPKNS